MRKHIFIIGMIMALLGAVGCGNGVVSDLQTNAGGQDGTEQDNNGQDYFNGRVLAVHDTYVEVECTDVTTGAITEGTKLSVTLNVASAGEVPTIEVGDLIRVVFTNVLEIDPPGLGTVWAIYLLEEDGTLRIEGREELEKNENSQEESGTVSGEEVKGNGEETASSPSEAKVADWGITLSVEDVTPVGMTLVITQSGGKPTGTLEFGSEYYLEVLENGSWTAVPYIVENVGWTQEAYIVAMEESLKTGIYWEWIYGILEAGTYRLNKEFLDFRETGDFDKQSFSVEFVITEGAINQSAEEQQTTEQGSDNDASLMDTSLYFGDSACYIFTPEEWERVYEILENLEYDPEKVCDCLPEFTAETRLSNGEVVSYGIDFEEGYVRCEKGQAELNEGQQTMIESVIYLRIRAR